MTAVAAVAGAATQLNLAPFIQFLLGGGFVGLIAAIVVWRKFPHEADKLDAQRDEIMQDLGRKNTEAAAHVVDLVKDEIEALKAERSSLRDRALGAEAAAARAKAEQAQTLAELATEKAERSTERHDMRSELTARDAEIATLRREVAELRAQLAQLLASQGLLERRHVGD